MKAWAEAFALVGILLCMTTCTVMREQNETQVKIAQMKVDCK